MNEHVNSAVSEEDRRDFLKALGLSGALAVGSTTLSDVRDAVEASATAELAPVGESIEADLAGQLDADLIAAQQAELADATAGLPVAIERGFPEDGMREEFQAVADAGWPVYEHLREVDFFESTTKTLPEFTPEYLESSVETFVGSSALAEPLDELGLGGREGVDLVATVIANADDLSTHHWVKTTNIPREKLEFGEFIPWMTQGAAGGSLLWLEAIDEQLYVHRVLMTEEMIDDAVWHAQSLAAGFQLMSEGARHIAEESGELSNAELGALLSTGFAIQAIAQALLPQDVFWITEDMRAERRTDVRTATEGGEAE